MFHDAAAQDVIQDVGPMQPGRHVLSLADPSKHEGEMLHLVERRRIGIAGQFADRGLDREGRHALDQLLTRLPVFDEVGHRDGLQAVLAREGLDLLADHDGAVIVGEFADHRDRRQVGEPAEIDRRLRMARAHQNAAILGDQREDVARADEVRRAHVAIGESPHRVAALLGRDAGGQAVPNIDRNREGRAERRIVGGHHGRQMKAARIVARHRHADDAAAVADDEGHLLRRAKGGGADQIAFVLAIVVVRDGDDLAPGDGFDGFCDRMVHTMFQADVVSPMRLAGQVYASAFGSPTGTALTRPSPSRTGRRAAFPTCARCRRKWSASTQATMASPTGTARIPTQGS